MARRKRLTGEAYWKLHDLLEEGDQKVKEYGVWARKECRRLNLLPDVADLLQGVVWNEPLRQDDPTHQRHQVALIDDETVIEEAVRRQADVDVINAKIDALIRKIAMAANVRPEQVKPREGEIIMEPEDPEVEDLELQLQPDE
jgi:hypothetical protein